MKGSVVVGELERLWTAIQAHHPTVPDVFVMLGECRTAMGWLRGMRVTIAHSTLRYGPETVAGVLLHEAVHASLRAKGCRKWGEHRGDFQAEARRFGLEDTDHRYGTSTLTGSSRKRYAAPIEGLRAALREEP